jgi:hypothetical protein
MYSSMAEYPRWFVITCEVLVAVVGIWIVVKLIRAALWLLLFGFLFFAVSTAVYYFLR